MAYWCRHLLVMLLPVREGDAMYLPGAIDGRVMAMSVGICLVVTLIIGLVPALQTHHLDLAGPLKAESGGVVGVRSRGWIRSGLVIFQVCLSFILLVGAALLLESLQRIRSTSPGFSTTSVAVTGVSVVAAGYDVPRAKTFQNELIDRLFGLPGIESAAFAAGAPLGIPRLPPFPLPPAPLHPPPLQQPIRDTHHIAT